MKNIKMIKNALLMSSATLALSALPLNVKAVEVPLQKDAAKAMSVVKAEKDRVILSLSQGKTTPLMDRALSGVVKLGTKMLRENNHEEIAAQLESEWEQFYSAPSKDNSSVNAIGDHKPIFEWLGGFYETLEATLGPNVCKATHLDDIKAINYGAPVAIFPNGDPRTGEKYDIVEYRKHFVPFSTAVVYWSMKMACTSALSDMSSMACSYIIEVPRDGYETFVAPYLSDFVYKKTTHTSSSSEQQFSNP
ncbi:MAG: hypothetical protein ACXVCY_03025 [Pseudobdellovibrionaceae bacterium]